MVTAALSAMRPERRLSGGVTLVTLFRVFGICMRCEGRRRRRSRTEEHVYRSDTLLMYLHG